MFSPRGKNMLTFCVFLTIATLLWIVMSLNQEVQRDLQCRIAVVNCPDTVTRITDLPETVNVSLRANGTQLFTSGLGSERVINIDYRNYAQNGVIHLSPADLRAAAHKVFGQSSQILSVNPDTLRIWFTDRPPVRVPLLMDVKITPAPNCAVTQRPHASVDSVKVYSVRPFNTALQKAVVTGHFELVDGHLSQSLPVTVPAGCRAVPEHVTVTAETEPVIQRQVSVPITTVNVPKNLKLITLPGEATIAYLTPMSQYETAQPRFRVTADFKSLTSDFAGNHIHLRMAVTHDANAVLDAHLLPDSVEYIIERQ